MSDERIDIEITDKVSPEVSKSLNQIADSATKAGTAVERLKKQLASIDTSAVNRLAMAQAKLTNSSAREISAQAKLQAAMAKSEVQAAKTAVAQQRLATEKARTAAQDSVAAKNAALRGAAEARTAATLERTAAATARKTAATSASNAADRIAIQLQQQQQRAGRQRIQQLTNLTYQLNDIVVSLASGQRPMTVLLQQGSQISTIFGPGNGVLGTLQKLGGLLWQLIRPVMGLFAALAVAAGGFTVLQKEINKTSTIHVSFMDVVVGTFKTIASGIGDIIAPAVKELTPIFQDLYDFIVTGGKFAINTVVQTFKTGGVLLGTAFTAAYMIIGNTWRQLPALFSDIMSKALNSVITALEKIINGFIEVVNKAREIANDASNAVGQGDIFKPIAKVDLSQYKRTVTGAYEDIRAENAAIAADIGNDANKQIEKILNTDFAGRYADQISASAQERARKRKEEEDKKKGKGTTFSDIVKGYQDEIAILKVYGEERKRIKAILDAENQLKRRLTETEKAQLVVLQETRDLLQTMDDVYQELNGPVEDYKVKLAAINKLLEQGLISQQKYNVAVGNIGLVRDLRDVKQDALDPAIARQGEIEQVRLIEAQKLSVIQDALDQRLIMQEEHDALMYDIKNQAEQRILEIEMQRWRTSFQEAEESLGSTLEAVKQFAGEQSGIYKAIFVAQKAFAMADAIMNTYSAVSKALASSPPPMNYVYAAIAAAKGAAQVAGIASTVLALKDGGMVNGPGTSRSDSVPARLSNGEFVVNAEATKRNRPLLEALNDNQPIVGLGSSRRVENKIAQGSQLKVTIQNYGTSKNFDVEQLSADEVRVIARDEAKQVVRKDAPRVVANDIGNPNGVVSKSINNNTKTERKR